MKSIFTKTIIAAAIASVGAANAATLTANGGATSTYTGATYPLVSLEGLGTQGGVLSVGTGADDLALTLTTGAAMVENDRLVFTFTGATLDEDSTVTYSGTAADLFTLLGVDADAGTVTFRVTSSDGVDAGETVILDGVDFEAITAATAISVASTGIIAGSTDEFDDADATTIAAVASEFSITNGTDYLDQTSTLTLLVKSSYQVRLLTNST